MRDGARRIGGGMGVGGKYADAIRLSQRYIALPPRNTARSTRKFATASAGWPGSTNFKPGVHGPPDIAAEITGLSPLPQRRRNRAPAAAASPRLPPVR
jgi:hypothetical protein